MCFKSFTKRFKNIEQFQGKQYKLTLSYKQLHTNNVHFTQFILKLVLTGFFKKKQKKNFHTKSANLDKN